ncbi:hypothetical protein JB92DRAFT_156798 [Gautieria morchelliformis]|nr:hypothetical protein JB92DRAFT_156798 [Gautieria morchelliformis]
MPGTHILISTAWANVPCRGPVPETLITAGLLEKLGGAAPDHYGFPECTKGSTRNRGSYPLRSHFAIDLDILRPRAASKHIYRISVIQQGHGIYTRRTLFRLFTVPPFGHPHLGATLARTCRHLYGRLATLCSTMDFQIQILKRTPEVRYVYIPPCQALLRISSMVLKRADNCYLPPPSPSGRYSDIETHLSPRISQLASRNTVPGPCPNARGCPSATLGWCWRWHEFRI